MPEISINFTRMYCDALLTNDKSLRSSKISNPFKYRADIAQKILTENKDHDRYVLGLPSIQIKMMIANNI